MSTLCESPRGGFELPPSLRKLPPLPSVALKAMRVLAREEADTREIEEVVSSDTVFAADLLCCANSALFGLPAQVKTLRHAIMIVGRERLKGLILTTALRSFVKAPLRSSRYRSWWNHSLGTAMLSEAFVVAGGFHCPEAYTAGLLHDIGSVGLLMGVPEGEYREFQRAVENRFSPTIEAERERWNTDHCELGGMLLEEWGFPEEIVSAARRHRGQEVWHGAEPLSFTHLSCMLSESLGFEAVKRRRSWPVIAIPDDVPRQVRDLVAPDRESLRRALHKRVQAMSGSSKPVGGGPLPFEGPLEQALLGRGN
ncbi:MAG: HDOD domain-containing protein [Bryobacteraceae bacterium]